MDDLKPIIYIIFIAIYLIFRVFKGVNKKQKPTQGTVQPPIEKNPESIFDAIREELKRQQELAKAEQQTDRTSAPKKVVTKPTPKKTVQPKPSYARNEPIIEPADKEGISAFDKRIKRVFSKQEQEESPTLEFDPREAFRMKTLLERHPLV